VAIPNTTPTPNELYNGEMKKMGDTELRVVLIVTRATLGWEIDTITGRRKQEDWISQKQLVQKSGRSNRAIATAITSCIKNGWVEARDKQGNLLIKPEERARRKVFYRLGRIFLDKLASGEESSPEEENTNLVKNFPKSGEVNDTNLVKKVHNTKEILTKENIQNNNLKVITKQSFGNQDINFLIGYLKEKLEIPLLDGSEKTNRRYCHLALKKFGGRDKMQLLIDAASQDKFWATKITSFQQLYYKGVQIISDTRGGKYGEYRTK